MSETKWTAGPWKAYELDPADPEWEACEIWPAKNERDKEDGLTSPVATIVCGVANARLISAAPELYEALDSPVMNQLLGEIEDGTIDPALLWSLAQQWMELRDAALAKARGEQP